MPSNLSVFSSEFRGVQSFGIADNYHRNRPVLGIMSSLDLIFETTGYFTAHLVPSCVNWIYISTRVVTQHFSLDTAGRVEGVCVCVCVCVGVREGRGRGSGIGESLCLSVQLLPENLWEGF